MHVTRAIGPPSAPDVEPPFAADYALVDCYPKELPQRVLLKALLAQVDHYVSDEIMELPAQMGIVLKTGFAVLIEGDVPDISDWPTPIRLRRIGNRHAVFVPNYVSCQWSPVPADAADVIARALDEWERDCPWGIRGRIAWDFLGWRPGHKRDTVKRLTDDLSGGGLCVSGTGTVAYIVGSLSGTGTRVVGVEETRWAFDLPSPGGDRGDV